MATATASQPISGVSAGRETVIEEVYPSICASGLGRALGQLMDCVPVSIGGIRLSHALFAPIAAPLGVVGYLQFKVTGVAYVLTNQSVVKRASLGQRLLGSTPLAEIASIEIQVLPGQEFYHAGDLLLLNANGDVLLHLEGIPRPERFRQVILDAREARLLNDQSLEVIRSRG